MTSLLLFSAGDIGDVMSRPGIRYYNFAKELANDFQVTLMIPNEAGPRLDEVEVVQAPSIAPTKLAQVLARFDVIVAQRLPLATMRRLARMEKRVIYDLSVPVPTENLAMLDVEKSGLAALLFARADGLAHRFSLLSGSAFVCASERHRDFLLGMLEALGRVDLDQYRADPMLRNLVDVVPFGLPAEAPVHTKPVLKGVVPGIRPDDRVLLWAGGIWNWFDPFTVIRAAERLSRRRDDVKLVFLALDHPQTPRTAAAERALELARSLGLLDRFVFFNERWVPYEERQNFLLEADLGVSAHYDTIETRYAFRTRMLDYFWASLPTVVSRGEVLSELVAQRGLGRVVDAEDVDGWVEAIEQLLEDGAERRRIAASLAAVREELAWSRVVEPLARLARLPGSHTKVSTVEATVAEMTLRLRISLALGGPGALLRRQVRKLGGKIGGSKPAPGALS